jgi:hypothetical protein
MPKSKEAGEQIPAELGNPAEAAPDVMPEEHGGPEGPAGEVPPGETPEKSGGEDNPENKAPETGGEAGLASIEEHAERLKIGKPILAAVMQSEGWAAGKQVTEEVFKTAINAFLNTPMGGKPEPPKAGEPEPSKDGEQKPAEGDKLNGTA